MIMVICGSMAISATIHTNAVARMRLPVDSFTTSGGRMADMV